VGAGALAPAAPGGYEPGRVFMACAREGYAGLVVLEDGRLDIAAALRPEAVRHAGGIGLLVERILARAGLPSIPEIERLRWKGTPILTRTPHRLAEGRVFRVGDAAGYVEPFTGEGIAWAIAGGRALGAILASAGIDSDRAALRWERAHAQEVERRQLLCRAARGVLRSPLLTRSLVRTLAYCPPLARPFLAVLHRAS